MKNYIKFIIVSILIVLFSLILISSKLPPQDNLQKNKLEQIRAAIKEKGAEWTAGETWVSRLSLEEFKKLLGLREPEITAPKSPPLVTNYPSAIDWVPGETEASRLSLEEFNKLLALKEGGISASISPPLMIDYPSAIDWRNKDGYNWVTFIKNQGDCGSCVAFGACATLESLVRIELYQPNKEIDLSEMHLFMCGGRTCESGWYNDAACTYLMNNGTSDNNCWPYWPITMPCSNTCSNWQLRAVKITDFGQISGIEACKTYVAIAPILAGMRVYEDFREYRSGIYEHVWGDFIGNHAICIVGYNTNYYKPYWICKNSWGSEDWGENGFFKIRMGECEIETLASYWMSGNILPSPPAQAPSNLSAYSTSWYDVILDWQDNSNNIGWFEVQRHKAGEPFSIIGETIDDFTSFHDSWFNGDYTYSYRVRAENLGGSTGFSNTIDFTINRTPIDEPGYLEGYFEYFPYGVHLTWYDYSNNEQGFEIERKNMYEPNWYRIDIAAPNATSYDDTNVWGDNYYYYRVRAYNPYGYSYYSNTVMVYVPQYLSKQSSRQKY